MDLPEHLRRADVLESLVELYLRLNGYFCIRNYLYHRRPDEFGLRSESDLLAIRIPHQQELLPDGSPQQNDTSLILPKDEALVDCLIAEVKEPSVEFNEPMRNSDGVQLITDALRMFGHFPSTAFERDGAAYCIARKLHKMINEAIWTAIPRSDDAELRVCVRMLVFAPRNAKHAHERSHTDLEHVLDFTRRRMLPGVPCGPYRNISYSPWRGCTRLIVETFDKSYSQNEASLRLEEFIERVLSRWAN